MFSFTGCKRLLRPLGVTLTYSPEWEEYRYNYATRDPRTGGPPREATAGYDGDLECALSSAVAQYLMDRKASATCSCESCIEPPESDSEEARNNKWLQRLIHAAEIAGGFSIDYLMTLGLEQPVPVDSLKEDWREIKAIMDSPEYAEGSRVLGWGSEDV